MKHVPYRNSKLTRLLQESLGGNCRSIMVANVSPSSVVYEDSVNTLRYATGARKIKSNLEKNLVAVDATAAEMAKELEGVQVELRRVKEEYAQLSAQDAARLQEIEALKETVTKLTQQKAETAAKLDKFQTAFTKRFKKLGSDFTEVGLWVIDKFDDLDSGVTTSVDSPDTPSIAGNYTCCLVK